MCVDPEKCSHIRYTLTRSISKCGILLKARGSSVQYPFLKSPGFHKKGGSIASRGEGSAHYFLICDVRQPCTLSQIASETISPRSLRAPNNQRKLERNAMRGTSG